MKQKVLIWYFRLESTTLSIMKVGEKGHYLQTEVMIILKADRKKLHACSYLSMLSFGRTGTSCRKFNLFVILWRSNINLRNCKFDFQYHCLPTISYPFPCHFKFQMTQSSTCVDTRIFPYTLDSILWQLSIPTNYENTEEKWRTLQPSLQRIGMLNEQQRIGMLLNQLNWSFTVNACEWLVMITEQRKIKTQLKCWTTYSALLQENLFFWVYVDAT